MIKTVTSTETDNVETLISTSLETIAGNLVNCHHNPVKLKMLTQTKRELG